MPKLGTRVDMGADNHVQSPHCYIVECDDMEPTYDRDAVCKTFCFEILAKIIGGIIFLALLGKFPVWFSHGQQYRFFDDTWTKEINVKKSMLKDYQNTYNYLLRKMSNQSDIPCITRYPTKASNL